VVIPIHDDNPVRRTPWVTYLLIAINIAVFFAEPVQKLPTTKATVASVCQQDRFFSEYAAIPKELTTNHVLSPHRLIVKDGTTEFRCPVVRENHKSPALSVLTAMFLHGGLLHLLGNMLFLFIFGNNVEDRMGRIKYLVFYLVCGYAAAYGFALANASSTAPLIGASGAIAGVLGAYLVLFPRARVTSLVPFLLFLPLRLPAWLVLGFWFLLQWVYSSGSAVADGAGVAYLAHVVGFVVGAVITLAFGIRRDPPAAVPDRRRAGWPPA
jgi:membrane associated rhomboid family serine protease